MSSPTAQSRRLVVKVGTAVVSRPEGGLNEARIRDLAEELSTLISQGHEPVLVTSGAIGAGMDRFGWKERPTALREKQAAAAVGQVLLMEAYERAFSTRGVTVAQVLLTRSDLEDRARYLNARNTLNELIARGVLPVINENDTVATEEIKFGDNDSLAAQVAVKVGADNLFLLTDVDGLLEGFGDAPRLLPEVFQITPDIEALVRGGAGTKKSAGGMASKIRAAQIAMASGVEVWIASGRRAGVVREILSGRGVGTRFRPLREHLDARRRWLAFGRRVKGTLVLDDGAVAALVKNHRSLLPSGVVEVEGHFETGETVRVLSRSGEEVARGSVSFSSSEIERIKGRKTAELAGILGRAVPAEVIHRNNLVIFQP